MGRPGMMLHRKTRRLARDLDGFQIGFGAVLARGHLELLWDGCYENGDPYLGDATDVEARAGWGGREGVLTAALLEAGGPGHAGFIEEGGSPWWPEGKPATYRVHDLFDHAPRYVRRRVHLEAKRQAEGKSISDQRAEAGKRGAAVTNSKRPANGRQVAGNGAANGRQRVATPAPAPAPAHSREEASPPATPESSATPTPPLKARRAKKAENTGNASVEPVRLSLVALIRSKGVDYVDTAAVAERTQLKRVLAAGVTEKAIVDAYEAVYARGTWAPGIKSVADVLRAASERPAGRNGAAGRTVPGSELRDLAGFDDQGEPVYRGGKTS